jgi:hypothetical protein
MSVVLDHDILESISFLPVRVPEILTSVIRTHAVPRGGSAQERLLGGSEGVASFFF